VTVAFATYVEPTMPRVWDAAVVVATVLSLGVVVADGYMPAGAYQALYLDWADLGFCALFLIDFGVRFSRAADRRAFVRRNWIDLVSSIPVVDALRAGRVVRLLRLVRMVRTGFVRRLLVERYGLYVSGDFLNGVGFAALSVWLATATAFYAFERGQNSGIEGFGDALWWSMTTLSTVGYGDLYPVSLGGRIVAVVTMVLGVGVIGTLAATVATAFIDVRDRGKRGLRSYSMEGHLLVLGWNDKAELALAEFRADERHANTPIVVVADLAESPTQIPGVRFVRGVAAQREALERASASSAAAAVVFANDVSDPRSDHESALTVLALRRVDPELRVSAELIDEDNREHLVAAGADAVIEGQLVASALLMRSVRDAGVVELVTDLLTSQEGSEIRRQRVPQAFLGGSYGAYAGALGAESRPVLGLVRRGQVLVNPPPATRL
jgi:voltage-gated potassium channel